MIHVTVLFKSGGVLNFDAADLTYHTASEESVKEDPSLKLGDFIGYSIDFQGTDTSHVYLDVREVAGLLAISDDK